jgi:hypothetical protein
MRTLIAVLLIFVLAGCGGDKKAESSKKGAAAAKSATQTTAPSKTVQSAKPAPAEENAEEAVEETEEKEVAEERSQEEIAQEKRLKEVEEGFPVRIVAKIEDALPKGEPVFTKELMLKLVTADVAMGKVMKDIMDRKLQGESIDKDTARIRAEAGFSDQKAYEKVNGQLLELRMIYTAFKNVEMMIEQKKEEAVLKQIVDTWVPQLKEMVKKTSYTKADYQLLYDLRDEIKNIEGK